LAKQGLNLLDGHLRLNAMNEMNWVSDAFEEAAFKSHQMEVGGVRFSVKMKLFRYGAE